MLLEHLRLFQFRCYDELELEPDSRFNVITGLNGQGKTSILEAIALLTTLRSFRNARNAELIRLGQSQGKISGAVQEADLNYRLDVNLNSSRKTGTINGKACRFLSEYVGKIPAVTFSPMDLEIVRGAPEYRRTWMDRISQVYFEEHVDLASRYQKVLENRNRLLREVSTGLKPSLGDDFGVWTDQLIDLGAQIIHNRIHTVDKTVDLIERFYGQIAGATARLSMRYQSAAESAFEAEVPGGQEEASSLQVLRKALKNRFSTSHSREKILGTTLAGPHRDDLEIGIEGNAARNFGSQGEIRSLVLAMRLAEVESQRSIRHKKPLLLIDDFSSELDANRRRYLLDYLMESGSQVFLSTTEEIPLGKVFRVSEARLLEEKE